MRQGEHQVVWLRQRVGVDQILTAWPGHRHSLERIRRDEDDGLDRLVVGVVRLRGVGAARRPGP
eukprot:5106864-Prymnesium_polylepis.1